MKEYTEEEVRLIIEGAIAATVFPNLLCITPTTNLFASKVLCRIICCSLGAYGIIISAM